MHEARPTWAEHALNIALASALRSEDPHCKVGACVLDARGIVRGVGYNGTVSGISLDWDDRDARRPYVIHAEANAMRYITPDAAAGGLLASTHFPCSTCVLLAASYGLREVVWLYPPDWDRYPAESTMRIAARLGVGLRRIDA
jgi:dCMP deaminase